MDDTTTLADLLSLNLHNFEEEVRGIVDKSVKEMGMEKVLKELDSTWGEMTFNYELHTRTGLSLIQSDEELIETLEENQVGFSWIFNYYVFIILVIFLLILNVFFCFLFVKNCYLLSFKIVFISFWFIKRV